MKRTFSAYQQLVIFFLCSLMLLSCDGLVGGNPTSRAQKDIELRRLNLVFDENGSSRSSNGEQEIPVVFSGSFSNSGNKDFESVTIFWFYRYRGSEDRGEYIIDDVKAGNEVDLSGDKISSVRVPGFAGGVLQTELRVIEATLAGK